MVKRISTAAARKGFASVVQASTEGGRVKLTRYNRTVAVLISKGDLATLEDCERRSAKRHRGATSARR